MSKSAILSNGNVNIGLNEHGLVSDFYFPDNGYNNHTLGEDIFHRIGIYINKKMYWINQEWFLQTEYINNSLIAKTIATHPDLDIQIDITSLVPSEYDAFIRQVKIRNLSSNKLNLKFYFHQNFSINASKHLADTAQFLPDISAILHYRGNRNFLVTAEQVIMGKGKLIYKSFDQYTVGLFGIENKIGSWMDAEDGILSSCNVEHGQTDSVIGIDVALEPHSSALLQYIITMSDNHSYNKNILAKVRGDNFLKVIANTQKYWNEWLRPAINISEKLPLEYRKGFINSLLLVKSHLAKSGAPIASNDSEMLKHARDDYSYCWPRDALYALWPLVRMGYQEEALKFLRFCKSSINSQGYIAHKYLPNGELGPSWHPYLQDDKSNNLPIQLDETASILFLAVQYYNKFRNDLFLAEFYNDLIKPMADFLCSTIDKNNLPKSNYELWEMDFLSTTYTSSIVYASLVLASQIAEEYGSFFDSVKWSNVGLNITKSANNILWNREKKYFFRGIRNNGELDDRIDVSSFYGVFTFGLFPNNDNRIKEAIKSLEERFNAKQNIGLPRFENDVYYRFTDDYEANLWIISSLWRAEYYISNGNKEKAMEIIEWVKNRQSSTGIFAEQINPINLNNLSVAPLTWSQAEYVSALLDLISLEEK